MSVLRQILLLTTLLGSTACVITGGWQHPILLVFSLLAIVACILYWKLYSVSQGLLTVVFGVLSSLGAYISLSVLNTTLLDDSGSANAVLPAGYWFAVLAAWASAWLFVEQLSELQSLNRWFNWCVRLLIPLVFGIWLLLLWEVLTRGLGVPQVLLPAPSAIGERFANSIPILWADFKQTFLKAVLIGFFAGCSSGFIVAVLIDRSPFLQRGMLPIGNLVSALPIVGVAPIMVMWFGFDWQSKAAVVIIMTFFPMLVNTVAGLAAASHMQKDLMKTYAANYWQTLFKLRLPEALPFIFNALKINSTLALIGAIVAEFFGTPIVGMGFRISTEVGRMNVDMVWAEICVAAIAGSLFYGLIALLERMLTFWHPSVRGA